mmetsp:Transcript_17656/g.26451  ORF Transcript_17656/g.26451 Transcript_17656/m.26451 type:complete len:552 (+) Transcript_17656:62-1717(+)
MFSSLERLSEVARLLQDEVVEKKLRYRLKTYKDAFVGSKAVDFLVEKKIASNRDEAVKLGNALMIEGFIRHVVGSHAFKDEKLFYNVIKCQPFTDAEVESSKDTDVSPVRKLVMNTESMISGKSNRFDILESFVAQVNEKANYLDMEVMQLRDAVQSVSSTIKQIKLRCDAMHNSNKLMVSTSHQQTRIIVMISVLLAINIGISCDSLCITFVMLLGVFVLGRDAFSQYFEIVRENEKAERILRKIRAKERDEEKKSVAPPTTPSTETKATPRSQKIVYGGQRYRHLKLVDKFSRGNWMEFNSSEGIPFETPNFKGSVIFKLRSENLEDMSTPYQDYFRTRARKFSLQVQGQPKYRFSGIVWLGAEIGHCDPAKGEDRMKLGFVRRTLCKIVLNTINLMRGAIVHYSFGDGDQLPHIMLPLYVAADTFVETGPSETPPKTGVKMFPEDSKSQKVRRKSDFKEKKFVPKNTYSFSLHNSNLDLYNWCVTGIPGIKAMDLTKYWADMPLRIVAYATDGPFSTPHTSQNKRYLFCFELSNLKLSSGCPGEKNGA